MKLSTQSFYRNVCHSALISGVIRFSSSFGKIKIHRILFQLIELVNITEFGGEVVLQLQLPQFCKLKNEQPETAWFFVFNLCFSEFKFIRRIVHMIYLLEQLAIKNSMCFCVTDVLRYSVSAPVLDLVTVGAVG